MVLRDLWTFITVLTVTTGGLFVSPAQCSAQGQSSDSSPILVGGFSSRSENSNQPNDSPTVNISNGNQGSPSPQSTGALATQELITPPNGNSQNQAVLGNQNFEAGVFDDGEELLTGNIYFSFDALFLERSGPSPQVLVITDGVPSLNSADFSYDAEFAPQITLGIGDPNGYGFEFSYFNSEHQFNGVLAGTAVTPIFFGGIPATPVTSYTVFADTQMDNYELNQWVRLNERTRLGFGLRIIDMREEYNITETGTRSGFFCITDNELIGGQLAGQFIVFSNDIATISLHGKSGLYYNHATVKATSLNAQITPDSDEFSFVGDLRLVVDLPLNDIFSFRFGYHATFLTQIAQALDQNDDLSIFNPTNPGEFDFSSPSYRGGFFGIVGHY